jgi:hypothetical protein
MLSDGKINVRFKVENSQIGLGRKRMKVFFIKVCNCMKIRILAFEKFGRKCEEKVKIMFVIQKFLLPLQPNN